MVKFREKYLHVTPGESQPVHTSSFTKNKQTKGNAAMVNVEKYLSAQIFIWKQSD